MAASPEDVTLDPENRFAPLAVCARMAHATGFTEASGSFVSGCAGARPVRSGRASPTRGRLDELDAELAESVARRG